MNPLVHVAEVPNRKAEHTINRMHNQIEKRLEIGTAAVLKLVEDCPFKVARVGKPSFVVQLQG
jgi:hypothetical protein